MLKYLKGNIKSAILGPLFIIVDTAAMISIPFFTSKIITYDFNICQHN